MDCSLFALLVCLNWSNVYIDTGLSYQDSSAEHQEWRTHVNVMPGVIETVHTQYTTTRPLNPYGRIALGYEIRFTRVTLALEASHYSSFETADDRGVNALSLKARWYPFRQ
jgi:hypothetical protein